MTDSIHLNPVHPSILVICSDYSHRHLVTSLGRRIPQVSAQWISQEVDCKGSKYRCACRISCLFPVFAQSSAEHQDFQPSVSGKADSLHIVGLLRKHVLLSHRNLIFLQFDLTPPHLSLPLSFPVFSSLRGFHIHYPAGLSFSYAGILGMCPNYIFLFLKTVRLVERTVFIFSLFF